MKSQARIEDIVNIIEHIESDIEKTLANDRTVHLDKDDMDALRQYWIDKNVHMKIGEYLRVIKQRAYYRMNPRFDTGTMEINYEAIVERIYELPIL